MTDRGIIVADACSLRRLQAGVRQEFYEDGVPAGKPVRRYLDLLPFLGEQGFRVAVPEMVSMEIGGVLAGAPNISDLFSGSRRNQGSTDTGHPLRSFLERTKSGKLPGVKIERAGPETDHGRYLDSLREIAADPTLSRKRKCDLLAVAQKKDRRDFGEIACLDAIGKMLDQPGGPGAPVFFLSDDREALRACHERFGDRVGRLNTKGLLGGFTQNGLFERLQIKPGLVNAMSRDVQDQERRPGEDARIGVTLLDNGGAPHERNDLRFQRQMEALATELKAETAKGLAGERDAATEGAVSRSEQFRQKWGWDRGVTGWRTDTGHGPQPPESSEEPNKSIEIKKEKHMELESATPAKENTAYETYKESFGFQVYDHRHERKLTPEALAAEVSNVMQRTNAVDKARVIQWEQSLSVPDRDQYKALETLLIDENPAIKPADKAEARDTFALAYERSKEVIQNESYEPESLKRRFAFGTLLREHHDLLSGVSLEGLAGKVNERLKIEITEGERELLTREPRKFIGAVEAGVVQPSKGLAVALVAALDKSRGLSEGEKRKLYDAYEAGGGLNASSPEAVIGKTRKSADPEQDQASPEVKRIQSEVQDFFREEGGKPNVTAIAAYARNDLGYSHGAASVVYPIMDESNSSVSRIRKVLSDTAKELLAAYLSEKGKSKEEVAQFEAKFDELRKATGHRTRTRSENGLSVA